MSGTKALTGGWRHGWLRIALRAHADAGDLTVLGGERLDRGDALQVVRQRGAELAGALSDERVPRLERVLEPHRPPDDHWDGQEREPRQVTDEHDERGADQNHGRERLEDLVRADVEEALELVDVVVEDRQQRTGLAVLEVAQLELLHMAVGLDAQVVLDVLGEVAPQQAEHVLED